MSELANATNALVDAKDAFDAYLAALDDPAAIEQMGFKRIHVTRLFDDSNPVINYPGGTDVSDATIAHTHVYASAFPDEATDIYFTYNTLLNIDDGTTANNQPLCRTAVTRDDGTVLSNQTVNGSEAGGAGNGTLQVWLAVSSNGRVTKPTGDATVTFQHRVWMTTGEDGVGQHTHVDNFDLQIIEVVR